MSRNFTPDENLIDRLFIDDTEAFEEIHRRYCYPLYSYCLSKLHSPENAKLITRDIMIRLWEKRKTLPVGFSISLHLYAEVRREVVNCLNEKLVTETDTTLIEKEILPGFSVASLREAREPVTAEQPSQEVHFPKRTSTPWWNQYPAFLEARIMKLALRKMLNLF